MDEYPGQRRPPYLPGPTRAQIDELVSARDAHYAAVPNTDDCRQKGQAHKRAYQAISNEFPGWIETHLPDPTPIR